MRINYIVSRIVTEKLLSITCLFAVFFLYLIDGLIRYENTITGCEAYILYVNSNSVRFAWFLIVIMSMGFPRKDAHILIRLGKRKWINQEIISLVVATLLFNCFIALACFFIFGGTMTNEWTQDFMLCYMRRGDWLDSRLGVINDLSGWVIFDSPYSTFIKNFFLVSLCGVITALVCFFFNIINKKICGPLIVSVLYYFSFFCKYIDGDFFAKIKIIDIYDMCVLSNINRGFCAGHFDLYFVIGWYVILILWLRKIIMSYDKQMEV